MAEVINTPVDDKVTGLIGWFATNHVAANLLMVFVFVAGIYAMFTIKKETMPPFETDMISVNVQCRGCSPTEVEEGIVVKIEEVIKGLEGIKSFEGRASEGNGSVRIEIEEGVDMDDVIADVQQAVDGISSFPADIEPPRVQEYTPGFFPAISVQISGDVPERTLRELQKTLKNEILALPEVSYVDEQGSRPYEIAIEVSEQDLREYGLTMDQIANIIRQWSVTMSGGDIQSSGGVIRVRATGQAYSGAEFEELVLLTNPDGTRLKLGDIATVNDGFVEWDFYSFFNGQRSVGIMVRARKQENVMHISEAVYEWADKRKQTLPNSISLDVWNDSSYYLEDRLSMMLKNLAIGGVLVFILLGIFLHLKIAAWVVIGLPFAFLGAVWLLPFVDVTINIISLFGFIVVIGVVVDDAIVIAESASAEVERTSYTTANIVRGAQRVAVPATFGVLTTVAAFTPLLVATGRISFVGGAIGWVVVLCLLFSLIESKLILPSHLSLMKSGHGTKRGIADWVDDRLQNFVRNYYQPFLRIAFKYRYATVACFLGLLIVVFAIIQSGLIRIGFFPSVENDFIRANVTMLEGSSEELKYDLVGHIDDAIREVNAEIAEELDLDFEIVENVYGWIQEDEISFFCELARTDDDIIAPSEIARRWRAKVGEISGVDTMQIYGRQNFGGSADIEIAIQGTNYRQLELASTELTDHLRNYTGLYEVQNALSDGPSELNLKVKPEGEAAGLTLNQLARQVRTSFFGVEVQRIQRGESEIRVMVRYPEAERRSVGNLDTMWIRLPDGSQAPFHSVAEYTPQRGVQSIRRYDGARSIRVSAQAEESVVSPQQVLRELETEFLPELESKYPGVSSRRAGSSFEQVLAIEQLAVSFGVALFLIYVLMAVPLKSYLQPLVIMSVIPFGILGAVLGHIILRAEINMVSYIGIIALTGVVVNDSLILVHYFNRKLQEKTDFVEALLSSGKARFRAILLTSLTTFFGLMPILLEQSMQAKFIHQMAISIGFGILFATLITLVLVPTLLRILADFGWHRSLLHQVELQPSVAT